MTRWLLISFGGICTLSGMITFWLPIPIGLPLMLLGVPILIRSSPRSRKWILRLLRRYPWLHKKLRHL